MNRDRKGKDNTSNQYKLGTRWVIIIHPLIIIGIIIRIIIIRIIIIIIIIIIIRNTSKNRTNHFS